MADICNQFLQFLHIEKKAEWYQIWDIWDIGKKGADTISCSNISEFSELEKRLADAIPVLYLMISHNATNGYFMISQLPVFKVYKKELQPVTAEQSLKH